MAPKHQAIKLKHTNHGAATDIIMASGGSAGTGR